MKHLKILAALIALLMAGCSAERSPTVHEENSSQIKDIQTKESTTNDTNEHDTSKGTTSSAAESTSTSRSAESESSMPDTLHNSASSPPSSTTSIQTGLIRERILHGEEGDIHYSCFLPESYDGSRKYPLMMTMPGYDMMWFGEDSSGRNVGWSGFRAWTELSEEMIVVSAQLTDWGEKSARQANELTRYFIDNFAVDTKRIYAAGYSAGGETMSRAVALRPDLYAAYLHGASQWDGTFAPIAENGVAVYVYMAENDEYYGSQKARDAYNGLYNAYRDKGYSDEEINEKLRLEIPGNEYYNSRGIYNYHGGGNIVFDDANVLNWVISHTK